MLHCSAETGERSYRQRDIGLRSHLFDDIDSVGHPTGVHVAIDDVNLDLLPGGDGETDVDGRVDRLAEVGLAVGSNVARKSRPVVRDGHGGCRTPVLVLTALSRI